MKKTKILAIAAAAAALCGAASAATIVVTSRDAAGVGFNDKTVVAPVGGNTGTTLGEQRLNVYKYVAKVWEQALDSNVTITVNAGWEALTCSSTSAVLGSASAWNIWRDFQGAKPGTWYHQALANKIAGENLSDGQDDDGTGYGNVDIKTQFNVNLGNTGCLDGSPFYLGLDGNAGTKVNFVETLLHELGHGLGFSVLTVTTSTGARYQNYPSVWEQFMYDNTVGKTWLAMTNNERKASAINPLQLAWIGPNTVAAAPMLSNPQSMNVSSPAPGYNGFYDYGTATFGPAVSTGYKMGSIVVPAANKDGCASFSAADAAAMAGKTAVIDRGTCSFYLKTIAAQAAGATGVIIANNAAGAAPGMSGADPTIVIPTISVSQADGIKLKAAVAASVAYGSRGKPGLVSAVLSLDPSRRAGADALGRPLLYTPNPLVSGSSVSHWDVSAFPNLLMEPNINADLTTILVPPKDLTKPLLKDLGW